MSKSLGGGRGSTCHEHQSWRGKARSLFGELSVSDPELKGMFTCTYSYY